MKELFTKRTTLCYGLSAILVLGAIVLSIRGGHDDLGQWMGIAGIAFAMGVASATGQLTTRKKGKD